MMMNPKQKKMMMLISGALTILLSMQTAVAEGSDQYALLIQQSPADGGDVTPSAGVHKIIVGDRATLIATPRPGYRFVYWLGDVSDPASNATNVQIDAPKMVVAVYEREEFENGLPPAGTVGSAAVQSSGAIRSFVSVSSAGALAAGSYAAADINYIIVDDSSSDFSNDPFPVPNEGDDDFPVPGETVPEPATGCLLALGAWLMRRRKRVGCSKQR